MTSYARECILASSTVELSKVEADMNHIRISAWIVENRIGAMIKEEQLLE
jgi:hypothetical protein